MLHAVPIAIGGGALVLGGIGLRLRALAKAKNTVVAAPLNAPAPPSPPAQGNVAPAVPTEKAVANLDVINPVTNLPVLLNNPDGTPHTVGTPFTFSSDAEAASAVAEANRRGVSLQQVILERSGQLAASGDGVAVPGQKAIVTTNDQPPSGDLIIRSAPDASAPQIGGAEKNGTVIVLDSSDATFAKIQWLGGSRLPAATGFARKAFLKLV